ncbi:ankyrin-3 isoform X4 [Paramuricea clavata]|uniref:Ankyrin-3 isoform X4 n=1 Tax=Paramuricea clavata TaxID=317549 RepID=A0A6S7IWL1_PARCT|nr:ankyrin-3 isoform X4 [Paramuricea clavata]
MGGSKSKRRSPGMFQFRQTGGGKIYGTQYGENDADSGESEEATNKTHEVNSAIFINENFEGQSELRSPVTGETALHLAAREGIPSIIEKLVSAGANPRSLDYANRTPLLVATISGQSSRDHIKCVGYLSRECPETVGAGNGFQLTPFMVMCARYSLATVEEMLSYSKFFLYDNTNTGLDPLCFACDGDRREVVKFLIQSDPLLPRIVSKLGRTPMFYTKSHAVAKILVENRCPHNTKDYYGLTPVGMSIGSIREDYLDTLRANTDILDVLSCFGNPESFGLLTLAAICGNPDNIAELMSSGVIVDIYEISPMLGMSAVDFSIVLGDEKMVRALVSNRVPFWCEAGDGMAPLARAVYLNMDGIVRYFCYEIWVGSVNTGIGKYTDKTIAQILCASFGNLLKHPVLSEVLYMDESWGENTSPTGDPPVQCAIKLGHLKTATHLLRMFPRLAAVHVGGQSPLCVAAHLGHTGIVLEILEINPEPVYGENMKMELRIAAESESENRNDIVLIIASAYPGLIKAKDASGQTPLDIAKVLTKKETYEAIEKISIKYKESQSEN